MLILIDEDISHDDLFSPFGDVRTFPGRTLNDPAQAQLAGLAAAEALIIRSVTRIDRPLLDRCPRLAFLGTVTTGTDHIDEAAVRERGIALADAAGCNALPVAEYVLAAITHLLKTKLDSYEPSPGAPSSDPGLPFRGVTLGILGRGRIGSIVSHWAARLGMTVLACDPPLARAGVNDLVPFDELAACADILTLHVPLTREGPDATTGMVNAAWLARLRPGARLINTSRGEIVDEAALLAALQSGRLAAAALDVWRGEPNVRADLISAAALATPHIAGYSVPARRRAVRRVREAFAQWMNSPAKSGVFSRSEPGGAGSDPPRPPAAGQIATLVKKLSEWSDRFKSAAATGRQAAAFDDLRREARAREELTPQGGAPAAAKYTQ